MLGGLFPQTALKIARAALAGDTARALQLSSDLEPLWDLFRRYGSLRVIAAAAERVGLTQGHGLPLPIKPVDEQAKHRLAAVMNDLNLH